MCEIIYEHLVKKSPFFEDTDFCSVNILSAVLSRMKVFLE